MTVLRGPADADHYRVKVGRYGDRWYTDPLPGCPIADASDWQGPSWSIVKSAAGKDWSYVTNKRNGHTSRAELERIATLEPDQRTQAFNAINKNGLTQAGGRGTIVHLWAEDLLAGRKPRGFPEPALFALKLPTASLIEALEYLPALRAFFDHYQPEVIAAEYVALHRTLNGHGYGCTPDVVARIQGQIVGVDWKSRGADSDHGAYPEEAAQIAAGAKAEYMIITGADGNPVRALLPPINAGIVVSIRPDGARIYPTDIDRGFTHVEAMHAFWVARLTERDAIGKPWPPIPTPTQETLWTTSNPLSTNSKPPSQGSTTQLTPTTKHATTRGTNTTDAPAALTNTTDSTSTTTPNSVTESTTSPDLSPSVALTLANAMLEWSPELIAHIKEWWPTGCPTPSKVRAGQATWTDDQLTAIEALCDLADAPFWQPAATQKRIHGLLAVERERMIQLGDFETA